MSNKRLILAGVVGRYPVGGVTWCALHYIAGFQALGFDVLYVEDTGECGFDPITNSISTDPAYSVSYIKRHLSFIGLGDAWAYVDHKGRYYGKSESQVADFCADADLMVNLSGGYWPRARAGTLSSDFSAPSSDRFFRAEFERLPKIFIDTDPGFTQLKINQVGPGWYRDFFASHHALFTFALNVESESCTLAETPFRWHPTVQPVALDYWPVIPAPEGAPYTTIMSWRTDSFRGVGKDKAAHLYKMINLPNKLRCRVLLAMSGRYPDRLLMQHNWEVTDGVQATIDALAYRKFIQSSRAELGFAKPTYIETRSGWFSDRTLCYLATGRPALVSDTGFSEVLPCGEGLVVFDDEQGLLKGMDGIESDYARHGRRAREIAEEFFSSKDVVTRLLRTANLL